MCDRGPGKQSPHPANQARRRPTRGRRQDNDRRPTLRTRAARRALKETTGNPQRQATRSSENRSRKFSTVIEKPARPSFLSTAKTALAIPETDLQGTKALWERVLGPKMPRGRRGVLKTQSEDETEMASVSGVIDTESVSLSRTTENEESRTTTKSPILWRGATGEGRR